MPFRQSTGRETCNLDDVAEALKYRFLSDGVTGCWNYTGSVTKWGYGLWRDGSRRTAAHRYTYRIAYGPIQDGLVIDHMCRNKRCVNPLHLRACTQRENLLAPWSQAKAAKSARRSTCPYGHPYDLKRAKNGQRTCRSCKLFSLKKYRQRRKEAA